MKTDEGLEEALDKQWVFCPWCGFEYSPTDTYCSSCDTQRLKSKPFLYRTMFFCCGNLYFSSHFFGCVVFLKSHGDESCGRDTLILTTMWTRRSSYVDCGGIVHSLPDEALILVVNVVDYEYWDVVVDSSVILGQLTAVALYATLFIFTYTGVLTVPFLFSLALFLLVLGFFTRITLESDTWTPESLFANIRSLILVFFAVWTLSPILRTLTEPLSNDTLIASSATCFAVHLFCQDYAYIAGLSDKYSAPVSLNAAIFGSVIVVSRLPSVASVFVIVSLAIELFALLPLLSRTIKVASTTLSVRLTWMSYFVVAFLVSYISNVIAWTYIAAGLFITFVCPYWLIRIQKYKNTINGPWDEAVPSNSGVTWKG